LKNARAVLAATTVPWEEASRYGTVITDEHERIMEFQEKPAEPKSNLVNMGIYAFKWHYLRDLLLEDSVREESSHDFGLTYGHALLAQANQPMPIGSMVLA